MFEGQTILVLGGFAVITMNHWALCHRITDICLTHATPNVKFTGQRS